ncbi:ABC transporter substrate-binding protein [Planctomonas sp. JC2975]|uniref:ABC transporter substrate-binding protein n=1 Tax=Planctomonas sp. JC2975 TaxID=2729626 RepID=UPI0014757745|nr:ABC transporter substrate-binding protein [Planctomonas sp. JC2975]NNC12180.1 ABC transporter substrate-binding protein [Planctomonas sp. JC2975]
MKITRGMAVVAAALVAVGLSLSGCSGSDSSSAAGDNVLTIGMPNGPQSDNSNPFLNSSAASLLGYRYAIYEPIAEINDAVPSQKATPWLATSWKWNAAYTKLTITARHGVTWSDGVAFSAADIAYSLQLRKDNPALNTEGLPYDDITTSGDTVSVTFGTGQFVNQVKVLQLFIVPEHIWKTIKDPTKDPVKKPVGTGPYVLTSWTPQAVTLKANKHYWGGKLAAPELRYVSYSGNDTLTTALVTGAAQWGWTFIADYQHVYIDMDKAHNRVYYPAGLGIDDIVLNNEKAPFNDVAVRRALNMVVDRAKESKVAESGIFPELTNVTGIPTPAGDSFISDAYKDKEFSIDVKGAKKVLTDAGYTYNGNTLIGKDGTPVAFTISAPAGWNDYDLGLTLIQASALSIGINVTIENPTADAWTDSLNTGNFQAAIHWTNGGVTPWESYADMFDPAYYVPIGQEAVWNYGRYQNDAAKSLFTAYTDATDDADRTKALDALQKIFVEDVPAIAMTAHRAGAETSTQYYTGWPSDSNPYANPQPTMGNVALILTKLKAATD